MKRAFAMIVALVVATPRIAGAGEPGPADAPPLEQVEQDLERRNADLDARLGAEATRTRERLDLDVQRSLVDQKTREEADRRVPGELRVEQARATKRQHFIRFSISMALSLVFLGAGGYELRAAKNEHDAIAAGSFATGADIDASNDRFEKDNKYGVVLVGAGALLGVVSILGLTGTLFDDPESASNRCCAVNAAQKVLGCIPDVNVKEDTAFTEVGARCLAPPVRPTFATQRPTQARTRSPMRADPRCRRNGRARWNRQRGRTRWRRWRRRARWRGRNGRDRRTGRARRGGSDGRDMRCPPGRAATSTTRASASQASARPRRTATTSTARCPAGDAADVRDRHLQRQVRRIRDGGATREPASNQEVPHSRT